MNFSKVKLLICVCLFVVNVIFFVLCTRLVTEKNYISEEEAALAEKNLAKNGINAEFDKDARRLYDLPVYSAKSSTEENKIPETYKNLTEKFFGVFAESSAYVKTPDGFSVSIKDSNGIILGSFSLNDNFEFECYYENEVDYKDIVKISESAYLKKLDMDRGEEYSVSQSFIETALKNYNMKFVFKGASDYNGGKIVYFIGELSDTQAPDYYLNIFVKKGRIVCCNGRITERSPQKKYNAKIIDSIDAMYILSDYIRENGNRVTVSQTDVKDINMVYKSFRYNYEEYYVIPAWVIEYTDENGERIIASIDAVTGENVSVVD